MLSDEALAQHITRQVGEELGLDTDGTRRLSVRIVDRNEAMVGTGTALVMYAPARVHLSAEFTLVDIETNNTLWMGTVYATGRNTMDEAVEDAAEQGVSRLARMLTTPDHKVPMNVVAREH